MQDIKSLQRQLSINYTADTFCPGFAIAYVLQMLISFTIPYETDYNLGCMHVCAFHYIYDI
jgi:hypothetical protein